jgi:hypothetical protein
MAEVADRISKITPPPYNPPESAAEKGAREAPPP